MRSRFLRASSSRHSYLYLRGSSQLGGGGTSPHLPSPQGLTLTPVSRSLPASGPSSLWPCSRRAAQGPRRGLEGGTDTRGEVSGVWGAPLYPPPPAPTLQEEGVMLVTGWVLLGLEEGIKVPERALHKVVSWHLREPGGHSVRELVDPGQGPPGCPPPGSPLTPSPGRSGGAGSAPSAGGGGGRRRAAAPVLRSCRA